MKFKIKRGAILLDKKSYLKYLIIDVQDDHIDCLDQHFDRISIGNNFLSDFEVVETIDMDKFSKWICGAEIPDETHVYMSMEKSEHDVIILVEQSSLLELINQNLFSEDTERFFNSCEFGSERMAFMQGMNYAALLCGSNKIEKYVACIKKNKEKYVR